jgi:parvulin-like peptidyl-prolyl isomerase
MNGRSRTWQALAAAVLALGTGTALGQAAKPVAVVNGEAIPAADLDAVLKRQPPSPTPLSEAQRLQLKREALDFLINEVVMRQFLQRQHTPQAGLKPNSPEVNKQIAELEAGLKKKNSTLAQFLKESGQTEAELRASIAKEIQWEAYVSSRLTDADVQRYYEEYKPFFDKVVVKASHILLRVPEGAKDIDRQVARNKLMALRKDILAGKIDFAEAARKYSECPSKDNGGDLGFFPRKFVVQEPFSRAAFALKPGEISDVVETDYGVHLIKVVDRSPGEPSHFDQIKGEVRRICLMELGMDILAQEHKKAKIEILLP